MAECEASHRAEDGQQIRLPCFYAADERPTDGFRFLRDDSQAMRDLFESAVEATAEAVWNSLCSAERMEGRDGVGAYDIIVRDEPDAAA